MYSSVRHERAARGRYRSSEITPGAPQRGELSGRRRERGGADAGRPDHRSCRDPFGLALGTPQRDTVAVDVDHRPLHGRRDAELAQRLGRLCRPQRQMLAVNPHLLLFVEGIQQYPDSTQPGGLDTYWWGGILTTARQYPVALDFPNQLVYSPHEYGPFKYQQPFFGPHMSYTGLQHMWRKHWAFLEHGASPVPIFIGEFGTCGPSARCVNDSAPGSQGAWFQMLMRYLRQHAEISWSFWALNGTNPEGSDQPNYILGADWRTVRLHQLIDALRDIELSPPPTP